MEISNQFREIFFPSERTTQTDAQTFACTFSSGARCVVQKIMVRSSGAAPARKGARMCYANEAQVWSCSLWRPHSSLMLLMLAKRAARGAKRRPKLPLLGFADCQSVGQHSAESLPPVVVAAASAN